MQITFFATDADLLSLAGWLLEAPGVHLLESSSRPDRPNRRFSSLDAVQALFQETGWSLAAWPESAGARPRPRSIEFDPETRRRLQAKGRTELVSPVMIGIHRSNDQQGCLAASNLSCWNERGARQRSMYPPDVLDEVDWTAFRSTVAKIQRAIKKSAPAKLGAHPIMQDAFDNLRRGNVQLWAWGSPCSYPSDLITSA